MLFLLIFTGVIPLFNENFGRGNDTIMIRNFGCSGLEETLQECRSSNYSISSYYSHGYHVYNRYAHIHLMISQSAKSTMSIIPFLLEGRWPVLSVRVSQLLPSQSASQEAFALFMGRGRLRAEWRSVWKGSGGLCVTVVGGQKKHLLCASN